MTNVVPTRMRMSPTEMTCPQGSGITPPRKPSRAPDAADLPPLNATSPTADASTIPALTRALGLTGIPQLINMTNRLSMRPPLIRTIPPTRMFTTLKASIAAVAAIESSAANPPVTPAQSRMVITTIPPTSASHRGGLHAATFAMSPPQRTPSPRPIVIASRVSTRATP